ncbi:MAG: hypothetical protein IPI67_33655 [Myxococcales bacterium]|nr:hypothetical protein [Myxococcales bacterium]
MLRKSLLVAALLITCGCSDSESSPGASAKGPTLSLEKSHEGAGTVTGGAIACDTTCKRASQSVAVGTELTLTASPSDDSVFLNWGGACSGSSPTCTVTVSADMVVNALFQTKAAMAGPTANGVLEPGEACDGSDLGGMTALMVPGYKSGKLACKADRSGYDLSGLTAGNTIQAASCSSADVQTAIDQAEDGDTVQVPAGTCSWTTSVTIGNKDSTTKPATGKALTLAGAGSDATIIKYQLTAGYALGVAVPAGKAVRVTGFTFDGADNTTPATGAVSIGGDVGAFARVDHSKFINLNAYGMNVYAVYGLIDHDYFSKSPTAGPVTLVALVGDTSERTGSPDDSWARPPSMGTARAIFLEDDSFDLPNVANGPEDAYEGARFVFRKNQVYGENLGWHGFDSSIRGTMQFEIYDNSMTNASPTGETDPNYPHGLLCESRSGTGVVYNNTVTNGPGATPQFGTYDGFLELRNYRSSDGFFGADADTGNSSFCNGRPHKDGPIDGNFAGMQGYPCKDQTGRTTNQELSPTYSWDNNFLGTVGGHLFVGGYGTLPAGGEDRTTLHLVEGRDFYNGQPKPGYVAYVYPHPLAL